MQTSNDAWAGGVDRLKMSRQWQTQRYVWMGPSRLPVVAVKALLRGSPLLSGATGGGINTGTAYLHGEMPREDPDAEQGRHAL